MLIFIHVAKPQASRSEPNVFAVKKLVSRDQSTFEQEVEVLRRVSRRPHPHLINLLATYKYDDQYHLLFPWAPANLFIFWRNNNPQHDETGSTARWLVEQCRGLASALATIHRYQRTSTDSILNAPGLASKLLDTPEARLARTQSRETKGKGKGKHPEVLHCRHGDIKPENILWFPSPSGKSGGNNGVLKISDFGVAEFNVHESVPRSEGMPASLLYKAPEVYLDADISTKYDVWGLGCIFLEFLAWFFGGWEYFNDFLNKRMAPDKVVGRTFDSRKFRSGMFFVIGTNPATGAREAWVKDSVRQFIHELHSHQRCTEFVNDFLDLIEHNMLVVEVVEVKGEPSRAHSAKVETRLEWIQHGERRSSGYFTSQAPWTSRWPWDRDRQRHSGLPRQH